MKILTEPGLAWAISSLYFFVAHLYQHGFYFIALLVFGTCYFALGLMALLVRE